MLAACCIVFPLWLVLDAFLSYLARKELRGIKSDLEKAGYQPTKTTGRPVPPRGGSVARSPFLALALGFVGSPLQAAPLPAAVVASWTAAPPPIALIAAAPIPESAPPRHHLLPSEEVCKLNHELAGQWIAGVLNTARSLGYYAWCGDPTEWETHRESWIGGGYHAEQMREEIEEAQALGTVWYAAWTVRWFENPVNPPQWQDMDADDWEYRLRELIGDAAYVSGRMPPPVPVWRVPRSKN